MEYIKVINHKGGKYVVGPDGELRAVREWYGTSDKEKPREKVRNGDLLLEVDTKKLYIFDAEKGEWLEL